MLANGVVFGIDDVIFQSTIIGGERMPILINREENVVLELNLIKNQRFDVKKERPYFENWIPFEFILRIEDSEEYSYSKQSGATFSVEDINLLIKRIESAISLKSNKKEIVRLSWGPIENYFSLHFYETYEDNQINIELWVMMAELTEGESHGYNRGFDFVVTLDSLEKFLIGFKEQLTMLLNSVE